MNRLSQGISIIVSAYKVENYIEDCLLSILKQNYQPIEVLIGIDNCSETLHKIRMIIDKYKTINPKVLYFKKNVGTYIVSNTLVELAKYPNILRFDSDDIMMPMMINKIMSVDDCHNVIRYRFWNFYDNNIDKKQVYHGYAEGCAFYTKLVFMLAGGYVPWECGADTEFLQRIKPIKNEYLFDEPLFLRRKHSGCLTENPLTGRGTEIRKQRVAMVSDNYDQGILQIKLTTNKNYKVMFDLRDYWEKRYAKGGNSGAGSYGQEALYKAGYINEIIKKYKIQTIQEYGSGDGHNMSLYKGYLRYCGYDVSPTAIELCRANPLIDHHKTYFTMDMNRLDFNADLALCLDVLFHQVEDRDYLELLKLIFEVGNHMYICLYTTIHVGDKVSEHLKQRPVKDDIERLYPQWKLIHQDQYNNSEKKNFLLYGRT